MADVEHVVHTLPRPDGGDCQVLRCMRDDGKRSTRLRRRHVRNGELRNGQILSIHDSELGEFIAVLQKIERKIASAQGDEQRAQPTERHQSQHKTRDAQQSGFADALDSDEERRMF